MSKDYLTRLFKKRSQSLTLQTLMKAMPILKLRLEQLVVIPLALMTKMPEK